MLIAIDGLLKNEIVSQFGITILKFLWGLFVAFILFKLINAICKKIEVKIINHSKLDKTISYYVAPLIRKILKLFVIVIYVEYLGIETSSIAAAITSVGLAIGLAMQGSLSNFAGGFIILLMRPFKVGDYIYTCGEEGSVESIQIFYTTLVTIDNRVIKIPNGEVANSSIIDASTKKIRRIDLTFCVSYKSNIGIAKKSIKESIDKVGGYLNEPTPPFINIGICNGGAIELFVRVWVKTKDYWDIYFKLLEEVKLNFNKVGIEQPYSKLDLNLINEN